MTTTATAKRAKEIGWIKARQKSAGMTDDEYRAMLAAQTGKSSAADLTATERKKVLSYLQSISPYRGQRRGQTHKPLADAKEAIERKIGWQLGQLGEGWGYAYAVAARIYPDVEKFEFLTVEQLGKISSALSRTMRAKEK